MMTNREKMQMLARIEMQKHYPKTDFIDDSNGELFYDMFSDRFFRSTRTKVLWAEIFMNRELQRGGECSINEYYKLIELPPLKEDVIWRLSDGYVWIDFDHTYIDHEDEYETYFIISLIPEPEFV